MPTGILIIYLFLKCKISASHTSFLGVSYFFGDNIYEVEGASSEIVCKLNICLFYLTFLFLHTFILLMIGCPVFQQV